MVIKIFAYGTLLKGMPRESILTYSRFLGPGIIYGLLYDLS